MEKGHKPMPSEVAFMFLHAQSLKEVNRRYIYMLLLVIKQNISQPVVNFWQLSTEVSSAHCSD